MRAAGTVYPTPVAPALGIAWARRIAVKIEIFVTVSTA
jgi:hypothetical protein